MTAPRIFQTTGRMAGAPRHGPRPRRSITPDDPGQDRALGREPHDLLSLFACRRQQFHGLTVGKFIGDANGVTSSDVLVPGHLCSLDPLANSSGTGSPHHDLEGIAGDSLIFGRDGCPQQTYERPSPTPFIAASRHLIRL